MTKGCKGNNQLTNQYRASSRSSHTADDARAGVGSSGPLARTLHDPGKTYAYHAQFKRLVRVENNHSFSGIHVVCVVFLGGSWSVAKATSGLRIAPSTTHARTRTGPNTTEPHRTAPRRAPDWRSSRFDGSVPLVSRARQLAALASGGAAAAAATARTGSNPATTTAAATAVVVAAVCAQRARVSSAGLLSETRAHASRRLARQCGTVFPRGVLGYWRPYGTIRRMAYNLSCGSLTVTPQLVPIPIKKKKIKKNYIQVEWM